MRLALHPVTVLCPQCPADLLRESKDGMLAVFCISVGRCIFVRTLPPVSQLSFNICKGRNARDFLILVLRLFALSL